VCLAYDQLITFDIEVARIWTLSWGLPKCIFFVNRYVVAPVLLMNAIAMALFPLLTSFCVFMVHWMPWTSVVALTTVETIQMVRVSALYGQSKYVPLLLRCLFLCAVVAEVVNTSIIVKNTSAVLSFELATGCFSHQPSDAYSLWIPFACFEGVIMVLTMYRVIPYRDNITPALRLFARDSLIYFSIMFSSLVSCLFLIQYDPMAGTIMRHPSNCIACIAVSRLMLNIRGLVVYDADDNDLDTIRFTTPHISVTQDERKSAARTRT